MFEFGVGLLGIRASRSLPLALSLALSGIDGYVYGDTCASVYLQHLIRHPVVQLRKLPLLSSGSFAYGRGELWRRDTTREA